MKTTFILLGAFFLMQMNPVEIILDETFCMEKTQQAVLSEENITVSIGKVSDSRCPENTNCIWAGELSVDLAITYGNESHTKTLVVPAIGKASDKGAIEFGDYELSFLGEDSQKKNKSLSLENKNKAPLKLSFLLIKK